MVIVFLPDFPKITKNYLILAEEENESEHQIGKTEAAELIRMYLSEGKYREAFKVWKASSDDFDDIEE